MRRSSLERKLVAAVVLLFIIPTAVAGATLFVLYRNGVLEDPGALLLTVLIGFTVMMLYLGTMAHSIGRWLVRALREIRLGTELMATVHPEHRLEIRTGDELEDLAQEVNRLADHLRDARSGLEAEVRRTTRELLTERGKLQALLIGVDEGLVVATLEGRITLANPVAQSLLGAARGGILGRSLFDFVDRDKVAHFLDRLHTTHGAMERFTLHPAGGAVLQAGMTPFPDADGRTVGFILTLRDVSRPAEAAAAHRRLLTETLRDFRGSLSSIRSLSENLLGHPAMTGQAAPLLQAIHAEALRLSGLVTAGSGAALMAEARVPWRFEELAVGDLLAVTLRRLSREGGERDGVRTETPASEARLRVEASALSGAIAQLLRAVLARRQPGGSTWVRATQRGRVCQIEAAVEGGGDLPALDEVLDAVVTAGMAGRVSVREIVHRHAGEVWAWSESGRSGFRVNLPVAEAAEPRAGAAGSAPSGVALVGAGLASGFGGSEAGWDGHGLYDFSFFDEMERALAPGDLARSLDGLGFLVFDTETTGLSPEGADRVVSIAGVRVRDGAVKPGEVFDALVKPDRPIPPSSVRFHGITDALVAAAPGIDVVLPAFLRFAEGAVLVGHEVWFDLAFLSREAARLGLPPLAESHAILDTRLLSQVVHGADVEHDLDSMAKRLGVAVQGRHSALGDALATAEVWARLLELLKKRGIVTLGQALDAARAMRGRGTGP